MSEIKNLKLSLGHFTLDVPELVIPDQGITAIFGPSGSGKTTLFNTMIGLHQPKNWSWIFKGEDLSQLSISNRRLGVVFQGQELFPHLTAEENVLIVAKSRKADIKDINRHIERLNLGAVWKSKAGLLSGGERQRVSLLRALLANSRMILMDEPFSALDKDNRSESRAIVKEYISRFEIPACLISHDEEDIKQLAQKTIFLKNGKLIQSQN